jgi:hypothetical protein
LLRDRTTTITDRGFTVLIVSHQQREREREREMCEDWGGDAEM